MAIFFLVLSRLFSINSNLTNATSHFLHSPISLFVHSFMATASSSSHKNNSQQFILCKQPTHLIQCQKTYIIQWYTLDEITYPGIATLPELPIFVLHRICDPHLHRATTTTLGNTWNIKGIAASTAVTSIHKFDMTS